MLSRQQIATKTVDECVNTYIKGTLKSYVMSFDFDKEVHAEIAKKLFETGMRLGGVGLKAMQFMANRTDLRPPYILEFSKALEHSAIRSSSSYIAGLLDSIPGLLYESNPIKSASIAQVHLGTYQSHDIIVKVQHEGVAEFYRSDLKLMAELGAKVNKYPEARGAGVMLGAISEKLAHLIEGELNFTIEASNQLRVAQDMSDASHPVTIAEILYNSPSVLIMKKLDGITGSEAFDAWKTGSKIDLFPKAIRLQLYLAYAHMILVKNFCQTDPHPGNFMHLSNGALGLLDFGQCASLPKDKWENWKDFITLLPGSLDQVGVEVLIRRAFLKIGIEVTEKSALNTLKLLFFAEGNGIFPQIDGLDHDYVSIVIVMLYLSRFEKNCYVARAKAGLVEDGFDPMTVVKVFQDQIGLRNAVLPDLPITPSKRWYFF